MRPEAAASVTNTYTEDDAPEVDPSLLTEADLDEIEDFDPDSAASLRRRRDAALDLELPQPDEDDLNRLRTRLDSFFHDWVYGTGPVDVTEADAREGVTTDATGTPGLLRIRAMRYHEDQMPAKYRELLRAPYRFRTNHTANEIERTVALATRNTPQITIAAGGRSPDDRRKALSETRWANMVIPALERQAGEPLVYPFFDALFEGGVGYWEVFQTGAYDDLDLVQREDEDDDAYMERTTSALMRSKLPFGVRVPDPLAVRVGVNDYGAFCGLIIERKPYRQVFSRLEARLGHDALEAKRMPQPTDRGAPIGPSGATSGDGWFGDDGTCECVRYYDDRWTAYMVNGHMVEVVEHGMPGMPLIPAWGSVTSSAHFAQKYMGIVWGTIDQEQALNDLLTTAVDIGITFARPKPVIETPPEGALKSRDGVPSTIDLRGTDGVPELMPGQKIVDAFANFKSHIDPGLLQMIQGIMQTSSLNPIAAGESPGSDPSGFAINSLQAATQMRYEILLDNGGRSVGMLIDFLRKMVKEGPIREVVNLSIEGDDGVMENLALGPDDISDVPCSVTLDPMNDVNRLAIRDSLMAGNQGGFVPRRIVMEQGFGAKDAKAWDDEIFEDKITMAIQDIAVQDVLLTVSPAPPAAPAPAGGEQPKDDEKTGAGVGAVATKPSAPSVGKEAAAASRVSGRDANRARGGQQPRNQGVPE